MFGKPECKRPLGRFRCSLEDNIQMVRKVTDGGGGGLDSYGSG
jgi:hypothetical protein